MTTKDDPSYVAAIHSFLTLFRYLRRYSRKIHESGKSGRQLSALRYLLDNGPTTMGRLSDYLYITDSTTTELISKLEEAGLVSRTRSRSDNRVVEVALTDAGQIVAVSNEVGGIPLLRERLKSLTPEELHAVQETFDRLNSLLGLEDES
ncbi:MAG TPA: MarR family transcriptional regulator [Spirochaetia bacterium]|nr:MarR family transcriptional regulator [Spirochaetia bacterium]